MPFSERSLNLNAAIVGLFSALLISSDSGFAQDSLSRIRGWQSVSRFEKEQYLFQRNFGHWAHIAGNESRSMEDFSKETKTRKPDPKVAINAAKKVAEANATDDLGFLALQFVLDQSLRMEDGDDFLNFAIGKFEEHYLKDERIESLLIRFARGGADTLKPSSLARIAFLRKVVEANEPGTKLRVLAAYYSAAERFRMIGDLQLSEEERGSVKADIVGLAKIVIAEGDEMKVFGRPAKASAQTLVNAAKNYSIGSKIEFTVPKIGGGTIDSNDYKGKVVVIDFWATWCVPCVASLPKVIKLKEDLGDEAFEVITISVDDSDEAVQKFIKDRMELPFANGRIGFGSEIYEGWFIKGVPTYLLLDETGTVQARGFYTKEFEAKARELVKNLQKVSR